MQVFCESSIVAATVYEDRARVTREARVAISGDEAEVAFDDLPESIDPRSVRLGGGEGLLLRDVRVEMIVHGEVTEEEKRKLAEALQGLEDRDRELADREKRIEGERTFVERISTRLTGDQGKPGLGEFSPDNWMKMVDFYRQRLAALDGEAREIAVGRRELRKEIENARVRLQLAGGRGSRTAARVSATLVRKDPEVAETTLALEYAVFGPTWTPRYDVRADSGDKSLEIVYGASVSQNTGEDWTGIALSLSTAPVHEQGDAPELDPVRVTLWVPPPPSFSRRAAGMMAKAAKAQEEDQFMVAEAALPCEAAPSPQPPPRPRMEVEAASVREGAVSAEFAIRGKVDVPSGGTPRDVTIAEFRFPADYARLAVPCLEEKAYLSAKARNQTDYPFLEGRSSVFLDGAFVAESSMPFTPAGAELEVSLGQDPTVKVEYRVLRDFGSTGGIVNKREKSLVERIIALENLGKTEARIVVKDRLPISGHQDVVVKLEEPAYRKDTDALSMDEFGILAWKLALAPGGKAQIPFRFSVERPQGARLSWTT